MCFLFCLICLHFNMLYIGRFPQLNESLIHSTLWLSSQFSFNIQHSYSELLRIPCPAATGDYVVDKRDNSGVDNTRKVRNKQECGAQRFTVEDLLFSPLIAIHIPHVLHAFPHSQKSFILTHLSLQLPPDFPSTYLSPDSYGNLLTSADSTYFL